MNKYVIEFIGTFFLVFVIALTTNDPQIWAAGGTPFAPFAIGSILMVMVYMGKHISGAHYNPAVTLAVFIARKIDGKDAVAYMVFQLLGAVAAALMFYFVLDRSMGAPQPLPGFAYNFKPMVVELLFTFALVMMYLNTVYSAKTEGNSYYGMAIGFTILAAYYSAQKLTGGAFNPAVGAGPTLVHAMIGGGSVSYLWIYLAGPFIGGILAALVHRAATPVAAE
jgi:aquaporin Z